MERFERNMEIETPYLARQYAAELTADSSSQNFRMAFFSPMISTDYIHVEKVFESPRCSTYQADRITPNPPILDFQEPEYAPAAQIVDLADDYQLCKSDYDSIMESSMADFDHCESKSPNPAACSSLGENSHPVISVSAHISPRPVVPLMSLPIHDSPSYRIPTASIKSWSPLLPPIDEMVEPSDEQLQHHDLQALSQRHGLGTLVSAQSQLDGQWLWQPWARTERWTSPPCPGETLEC
jgi:hypothetical protein